MVDPAIYGAGIAGMIGGLLWQGLLPYLMERKRAQAAGEVPPSFSGEYLTTMAISSISGFIAVLMAMDAFEKTITNASSIMISAGLGFSFVYTVLGISNTVVDLKREKVKTAAAAATKQIPPSSPSQPSPSTTTNIPTK